ncbi:dolichyl pyrophosphate Glc1Man9GlcNAc2 alpha-1,3-glucosyltransferase isoform 1 [Galdieria sulphuraria]|uniref:Alpha-1,3-glucosyltransferase n=1 Tax=Galdieria sulphuraria TaxID=130081 RepID=M2W1Y7_GALSU|nr:dolichyl pyrophosphate Glc1Man9GlcNAc2 alpha-1,3-glucosyltransferase isoform 1 [Galdieria sulphuraria]EME29696.1 dolichyl pyrophosphate Glc1Man9GlcNAc2 alpha-1,3-glucosyltransferase isoform 1 [Galdieria sulphuraria]|eukprot:XP_005706216.1 dolichyl pyrophosphate Glc1Man9GlcNAc2 alpha-1,3-glucosyltransferase isoform 1 [Galdieria sulphuraria]
MQSSLFSLCFPWLLLSLSIQCLLIPSYKSTDMDVHRYWKALTYSYPIQKWYSDTTSQWTLDYPPLFACLEWFLAQLVAIVDKHLVQLDQLQITTLVDVWVMRSTVILCDLCLAHAGYLHLSILRKYQPQVSDIQLSIMHICITTKFIYGGPYTLSIQW